MIYTKYKLPVNKGGGNKEKNQKKRNKNIPVPNWCSRKPNSRGAGAGGGIWGGREGSENLKLKKRKKEKK